MQKSNTSKTRKWFPVKLCLCLLACIVPVAILSSNIFYSQLIFRTTSSRDSISPGTYFLPHSLRAQVFDLQTQVGDLLVQLRGASAESKSLTSFADQLLHIAISLDKFAEALSGSFDSSSTVTNEVSAVHEDFNEPEETEFQHGSDTHRFNSGELRNYTSLKPNRLLTRKKMFLGVEAISPSVGLPCANMASNVDRFMSYKIYSMCPDDWDIAQKLMINGCDPLPRRRCFSKIPPRYTKPLPMNSSLWSQPTDTNVLWSHYKCKDYSCLVSNQTIGKRGFFKCLNCFDLSKKGWEIRTNESTSAEFTLDEVLRLKPGEIRIGLDFSPTTGTFAALMKQRNVTIASATLNLGAPFNEVIALRGLLPLYLSVGSRLPFFDNTLDIIHSTLFLDGWIGIDLLQFVLFDWDRVLRPRGLLWVDRFFCKRGDLKIYLAEFSRLDYKKLLWRIVPKTDRMEDEFFFSAVLEKPVRS